MRVELSFGDSVVMVADEFPEIGVLSPQSMRGTSTVLNLYAEEHLTLLRPAPFLLTLSGSGSTLFLDSL